MSSRKRKVVEDKAKEHTLSMSSNKSTEISRNNEEKKKHPGGPLQRKGASADSWNEAVGECLEVIPTYQLPTKRTILRKYRYLRINHQLMSTSELVKTISKEMQNIWNRARVPVCSDKNCEKHVSSVIQWWNKSSKFPQNHRMTKKFQTELDSLLDIAEKPKGRYSAEKGIEFLRNSMRQRGKKKGTGFAHGSSADNESDYEDDLEFYIDQKGPRRKTLGPVDSKLTKRETRKVQSQATSQETSSSTIAQKETKEVNETSDESSSEHDLSSDEEGIIHKSTSTTKSEDDYITLKLPKKDFMRQLSPLAHRLKLSNRQQTSMVAGMVKIGGGSLANTTLSVSSTFRQRREGIEETSKFIRKKFETSMPARIVLHWDGKVIKYENKQKSDDRLCIIGNFPGAEEDGVKKPDQFFGAPVIPNGTGRVVSQTLISTIAEWNIPTSYIIGMCWDTTASNTGQHKGSATHFEAGIMRALLWLACRHHVGELHVKHPDIKVRRLKTSAPEDLMFKKFQKIFDTLPACNYRVWEWPGELTHPLDFVTTRALEVLSWAEEQLRKGTFNQQRDDYRELCELVVVYLGGQVVRARKDGTVKAGFTMRHPGAFHHARFLAKGIYLIKMSMMASVLPPDVLPADKQHAVKRMAHFIVLFHAKYFLQAFLTSAAPRLDLQYWKDMCEYSRCDDEISHEVRESIKRHLWYLTQELSILALFDRELSYHARELIARALLSFPKPQYFNPGKPTFPLDIILNDDLELHHFVGPRSWLLFDLLQIDDHQWLFLAANEWHNDEQYIMMEKVVHDLPVVNDTAERAVKKVTDYANSANDGGQRGKIVEVAAIILR